MRRKLGWSVWLVAGAMWAGGCSDPSGGAATPDGDASVESDAPDGDDPDAAEPDATDPDASEPDATDPDASEPDVIDPDAVDPDAVDPDAVDPDAGSDVGPDVDPGPDPLEGTPLADLPVAWTEPLELCNAWFEGASAEDELAAKVRVWLPPQARFGLSPAQLGAAKLEGVRLARGPLAAQRFAGDAEDGEVVQWDLLSFPVSSMLSAELEHDLGEGVGVLVERYTIGRAKDQEPAPVVVTPDGYEVTFSFRAPGSEIATLLTRCEGHPEYEDAVSVLVGEAGARQATLVRYWRTQPEELPAGSYAVQVVGSRLLVSDEGWGAHDARGFWANTYVAQHHNWGDASVVDFTRDLGRYHTTFGPNATTSTDGAVARVALADVDGGAGEPRFEVTRTDGDGALAEPEVFTVNAKWGGGWRRVDANHLTRLLQDECAGGTVHALGFDDVVFQALWCPGAGGAKTLVGLVPVVFRKQMALTGERFGPAGITPLTLPGGKPGWRVALGEGEVDVETSDGGGYIVNVRDGGGQPVAGFWSEPFTYGAPYLPDETLEGASAGGEVALRLVRRWADFGVGESAIYAPVSLTVSWPGAAGTETREIEAWDRLAYTNTHHNWQDALVATTDDGLVVTWKVSYDFQGFTQTVKVEDGQGGEVLGETVIVPAE